MQRGYVLLFGNMRDVGRRIRTVIVLILPLLNLLFRY